MRAGGGPVSGAGVEKGAILARRNRRRVQIERTMFLEERTERWELRRISEPDRVGIRRNQGQYAPTLQKRE